MNKRTDKSIKISVEYYYCIEDAPPAPVRPLRAEEILDLLVQARKATDWKERNAVCVRLLQAEKHGLMDTPVESRFVRFCKSDEEPSLELAQEFLQLINRTSEREL